MTTSPAKSNRIPLLMSSLVYPGVGQFMQKRVFWGLVYCVGFTVLFVVLAVISVRVVLDTWGQPDKLVAGIKSLLKPFAMTILIWLANIYDTWFAGYRRSRLPVQPAVPPPLP